MSERGTATFREQMDAYEGRLVEAGYSEVVMFGSAFGPQATCCAKCGALILLGRPVDKGGEMVEEYLLAHSLWHQATTTGETA